MATYQATVTPTFTRTVSPIELLAPRDNLRLKFLFPDWKQNDALFDKMAGMPWEILTSSSYLNRLYFGYHSGYKRPSPYLHNFLSEWVGMDPPYLIDKVDQVNIAADLSFMFKDEWTKLFNLYMEEIDPMNNFHWKEIHSGTTAGQDHKSVATNHTTSNTDNTATQATDIRSGNVTDNTNFLGSSTNEKSYTGSETDVHENDRNITTGTQESNTDTNVRNGTVNETGATARYGFDSLVTGEGEPYDRRAGSTNYNNLQDQTQKTHISTVTETGTDGYTQQRTYTNRKDTDVQTFENRSDNNTVTYNNVKDENRTTAIKEASSSGTGSESADTTKTETQQYTTEVSGFRDVKYLEQLKLAFSAYEKHFFDKVFADIDSVIALSMY